MLCSAQPAYEGMLAMHAHKSMHGGCRKRRGKAGRHTIASQKMSPQSQQTYATPTVHFVSQQNVRNVNSSTLLPNIGVTVDLPPFVPKVHDKKPPQNAAAMSSLTHKKNERKNAIRTSCAAAPNNLDARQRAWTATASSTLR